MPAILPVEFQLGHDLTFVLHDFLTEHVVEGERAGLLFFKTSFREPSHASAIEGLSGEQFWDWCNTNDYRHILDEYIYRNLIFGLLSDMCHFLYEGLRCSEKGKLTVALSNFRKPLQDNLFYLEWILADRSGFLKRFRDGPEHIDPTKFGPNAKANRLDIIGRAMDATPVLRWIDPEWLYEMRYDKASDVGLDPVFNRAIHLVTHCKHYVTERESINFIFFGDDDRNAIWQHIYLLLPLALMHALHVVRALFATVKPGFELRDALFDFWLSAGFLLWAENGGGAEHQGLAEATFSDLMKDAPLNCPVCNATIIFEEKNLRMFWDEGDVECSGCKTVLPLLEPSHYLPGEDDELPGEDDEAEPQVE